MLDFPVQKLHLAMYIEPSSFYIRFSCSRLSLLAMFDDPFGVSIFVEQPLPLG